MAAGASVLYGQTVQWVRQFGSATADYAYGIAADATGVYIAGQTTGALPGQTSTGSANAYLRKYSQSGTVLWTRQFASVNARSLALDNTGVYVAVIGPLVLKTDSGYLGK